MKKHNKQDEPRPKGPGSIILVTTISIAVCAITDVIAAIEPLKNILI